MNSIIVPTTIYRSAIKAATLPKAATLFPLAPISSTPLSSFPSSSSGSTNHSVTKNESNSDNPKDKLGYRSIGSFHSENIEELIQKKDDFYISPALPFEIDNPNGSEEFLYRQRQLLSPEKNSFYDFSKDFLLDNNTSQAGPVRGQNNWTFLNHGAFGGALKVGFVRANQWRHYLELQPLRYFDRDLLPHLVHSARLLTKFVHPNRDKKLPTTKDQYKSMALVPNVTTALNAIIGGHSRCYKKQMVIFYDLSYGSVKKMARHYYPKENQVVEIPFQETYLPRLKTEATKNKITNKTITELFEEALVETLADIESSSVCNEYTLENSLLILDEVTSNTALKMPISPLTKIAKTYGMQVLVDGAHGLLANPVNVTPMEDEKSEEGIDYYVSNCHKWMSCPRGAAMLYCYKEYLRETVLRYPPVMSHGIDDGYLSRFLWDGCRDYAAQLSIPAVLDYWNQLGPENARTAMNCGIKRAVNILKESWHPAMNGVCLDINSDSDHDDDSSSLLCESGITIAPITVYATSMALVQLPEGICGHDELDRKTSADAKEMQDFLYYHNIEVPVKCVNGVLYVRISYHIYNRDEEYERLGAVINKIRV